MITETPTSRCQSRLALDDCTMQARFSFNGRMCGWICFRTSVEQTASGEHCSRGSDFLSWGLLGGSLKSSMLDNIWLLYDTIASHQAPHQVKPGMVLGIMPRNKAAMAWYSWHVGIVRSCSIRLSSKSTWNSRLEKQRLVNLGIPPAQADSFESDEEGADSIADEHYMICDCSGHTSA
ncbi:hypothetical protein WJX74_008610 [Apatococcus lobatus]|uniref:AMP-dependent synthetase/ligase domain-containing protein n=1 Tax=Apatococcus lobatus TaxID=904363 RepID=A0AAW1SF99_9CHLO